MNMAIIPSVTIVYVFPVCNKKNLQHIICILGSSHVTGRCGIRNICTPRSTRKLLYFGNDIMLIPGHMKKEPHSGRWCISFDTSGWYVISSYNLKLSWVGVNSKITVQLICLTLSTFLCSTSTVHQIREATLTQTESTCRVIAVIRRIHNSTPPDTPNPGGGETLDVHPVKNDSRDSGKIGLLTSIAYMGQGFALI